MKALKLKKIVAVAVAATGLAAVAEPTVTVDEVKTGEPWSKITVNYTLGGMDAKLKYKVAFDVTAKNETRGVTNAAVKLTDGAATKEIDIVAIFGKQVADTKAKVKVTLIAIKPLGGVQLWANGPFWAESNIGKSEVNDHPEYGGIYKYHEAQSALLGQDWRLPTGNELGTLCDTSYCTQKWDDEKKGWIFTGAREGYTDKSIFLPAAGSDGCTQEGKRKEAEAGSKGFYWSSTEWGTGVNLRPVSLTFDSQKVGRENLLYLYRMSVRAVHDSE